MLISLQVLTLTDSQFAAVMAFVSAVAVLGAAVVRQYVTPLVDPRDATGEPLTRSDNSPAITR
jgi:hypothetical protein